MRLTIWRVAGAVVCLVAAALAGAGARQAAAQGWPFLGAVPFRSDGVLRSAPATVHQPSFGHVAIVVGTDGRLWWSSDHTGWTTIGSPPVGVTGDPAAVSWADGRIDVFVRGGDNRLWQIWTGCGGCRWSGWFKPLGNDGTLASSPAATSWAPGRLDVLVLGTNGLIYQRFWNNTAWDPSWIALGSPPPGAAAGDRPGAASWGPGRLDVFVRGRDNRLWQTFWAGRGWTGWFQPPGTQAGVLASAPSPSPWGAGLLDGRPRLTVYVRGTTGHVYQTTWDTSWSPWTPIGAPQDIITGAPGAPTSSQARPYVLGRGTDDRCYVFYIDDPLAERAQATSAWAAARAGLAGFTVIDLSTGEIDQGGYADAQIRTASVIKVPIAMALMKMVESQGRPLTAAEESALQLMITQSDNNAATELWNEVGGNNVIGLMRALGATATIGDPGGAWGFTLTTSRDLAVVLARLAQGVLGPSATDEIITLMRQVIPSQAWGIGAAIPGAAIKNGWYPDPGDWRVNCLGIADGRRYALAIMTEYPLALGQGYGEAYLPTDRGGPFGRRRSRPTGRRPADRPGCDHRSGPNRRRRLSQQAVCAERTDRCLRRRDCYGRHLDAVVGGQRVTKLTAVRPAL